MKTKTTAALATIALPFPAGCGAEERKMPPTYSIFNEAIGVYSFGQIAELLQLNINTVKRWFANKNVPSHYRGDLCRIMGKSYVGETKREKDQFYTKPEVAVGCIQSFRKAAKELGIDLSQYTFIEPSAGCGGFYDFLPERKIGIDIEPKRKGLITSDYLQWKPEKSGKYIVIGNPPFGLRGHLALQFINHSYSFADVVAFILPPLFNSDGKGVPAKRINGYRLACTKKLPKNSFVYPDGREVDVSSIFQVYTKINTGKIKIPRKKTCKSFIRVYSLSDGGSPSSTRNKKMLDKCDIYLPSTCFKGMKVYPAFSKLPNKRGYGIIIHKEKEAIKRLLKNSDWSKIAFRSTNGALNLRTSLIENILIKEGYND